MCIYIINYIIFSDVSLQTRHVFVQFVDESSALKALAQNPPDYIMSKKLGMHYKMFILDRKHILYLFDHFKQNQINL